MNRSALLTWEMGGGRGHVVHLSVIAAALKRRGFSCSARLAGLHHAAELAGVCDEVAAVPDRLVPAKPHRRARSTYSDWLGLNSFGDADALRATISGWRRLMAELRPTVVVADSSPGAVLAAKSLGLAVVRTGVPAITPPAAMASFESILEDDEFDALFDERDLLAAVNEAMMPFGLGPFARLPEMLTADDEVVASIDLLDCYGRWRDRPLLPPVIGDWREPGDRERREVFVYLSNLDRFDPATLTAIASLDLPTRVVVAGNLEPTLAVLAREHIEIQTTPLPAGEIARRSRVLVHAGNHGMCCMGIRAGLPQVTIAEQSEHRFDGRQLASCGFGITVEPRRRTVPNIKAAVAEAWSSAAMADRAAEYAEQVEDQFAGDTGEDTADRITAVLAG